MSCLNIQWLSWGIYITTFSYICMYLNRLGGRHKAILSKTELIEGWNISNFTQRPQSRLSVGLWSAAGPCWLTLELPSKMCSPKSLPEILASGGTGVWPWGEGRVAVRDTKTQRFSAQPTCSACKAEPTDSYPSEQNSGLYNASSVTL